jgi:hypothetical protein
MEKTAFIEDDECWNIAERMIEEIGQIKGKKPCEHSKYAKRKGSLKRMLMSRAKLCRSKDTMGR